MKKLFGIFILVFLLNGCDDGDVLVENINFDNVSAAKCGDKGIIYKIKDTEVIQIILSPTVYDANFVNEPGEKTIAITSGDMVRYRFYNGTVTSASVCGDLQPATPTIDSEWIATSGTIVITTSIIYTEPDATTGAYQVARYNHYIQLKNITWNKPEGQQVQDFVFGDYSTLPNTLGLSFNTNLLQICPSNTTLYNVTDSGNAGLQVTGLDPALLTTDSANLDVPKTGTIGATTNKLTYKLFATPLTEDAYESYFCSGSDTPAVTEEWTAVSGTIEVTSTSAGVGIFRHTVRLKNATFKRGENTFYYGNDILYGTFVR
ncbi:hypothetical protein FNO01nite_28500 [Flavobacterium noncentrifugens]|uniref:Uncharacterized protein n=1 Tax=Flavobacterium noncentrifugens TaxID=1128970 RepID=A0A1G8XTJ6_9FLAO|nr:hypothetical protein [Flavobacterium noncentrifugens]GEP52178.1 hypothetical protein FNO01nite_28500 [Flavobacterium noncentrifugens]SDJ93776.1 hypothetical protein SAMN04487935_2056 [Flavobacterium noncentrifugens]